MKKRTAASPQVMQQTMAGTQAPPFSIVWGPIPFLSWLYPFIGHLGVCCSNGCIFDFAGPFTVNQGHFMVGRPTRYWQLEPRSAALQDAQGSGTQGDAENSYPSWAAQASLPALAEAWDERLLAAADTYRRLPYNLFTENCHAFVVHFLNSISYGGHRQWNMVHLATRMFLRAHYTGWAGVLLTWLPFCAVLAFGVAFGGWVFATCYGALALLLISWFHVYTFCILPRCRVTAPVRASL